MAYYTRTMPKRSSKAPKGDVNEIAAGIMRLVTGDEGTNGGNGNGLPPTAEKNPAAVALGRLGGLKGGKARARKLSAKRRKEIASQAAQKRWKSRPTQ